MTQAKGPGEPALLLLDVVSILNRRRVPYAVVGALAASLYGVVRGSVDADVVVSLETGGLDAATLAEDFRRAGLKSVHRRGGLKDPIGAVMNVEDRFGNRVDLLVGVRGMDEDVFSRVVEAEFMGKPVRFIGVEDFIAMKVFAGGPQDLSDVAGVLKSCHGRVNFSLLKELAGRYGKECLRALESLLHKQLP